MLKEQLYDAQFVARWVSGLEELRALMEPYNTQWAEEQTGMPVGEIIAFVREVAADAPKVIFHPGWMTVRHHQSFFISRTSYILNVLFGAIEMHGGLIIAKTPADAGAKGLKSLGAGMPAVKTPRVDGIGTKYKHWDSEPACCS